MFYAMANIASIIATIITPILRSQVKCYDADCYPVAFSIPTGLMLIAILSFVAGTKFYKKKGRQNTSSNLYVQIASCVFRAVKNKFFGSKPKVKKEHWLEYAETHHSKRVLMLNHNACKYSSSLDKLIFFFFKF